MRTWLTAAAGIGALAYGASAQAETLREALAKTYRTNPTLAAQRQLVEVVEEEIPIARSGLRPQVRSRAGLNQDLVSTTSAGRNFAASLDLEWPFFDGGRTSNRVRSAEALYWAQVATLRTVEGDVLTEAVAAYLDVLRARAVTALQANQAVVLEETLQATRELYEAGDLTLTDIAQAEARLALARSDLAAAEGRRRGAEQSYWRVIGDAPGALQQPAALRSLPASADAAQRIALDNSPELQAAAQEVRSAGFLVNAIRAERLPRLSAVARARYVNYLGTANDQFAPGAPESQSAAGIGFTAVIPLYQGGSVGARVRQARAEQSRLMEQLTAIERQVVARARTAYASYRAALESIRSNEAAVAANEIALEGTREEFRVGTRILLDILNAEQELLNSRVALVTAQRDAYVAGFSLLNAIGLATADDLDLPAAPDAASTELLSAPVLERNITVRSFSASAPAAVRDRLAATAAEPSRSPPAPAAIPTATASAAPDPSPYQVAPADFEPVAEVAAAGRPPPPSPAINATAGGGAATAPPRTPSAPVAAAAQAAAADRSPSPPAPASISSLVETAAADASDQDNSAQQNRPPARHLPLQAPPETAAVALAPEPSGAEPGAGSPLPLQTGRSVSNATTAAPAPREPRASPSQPPQSILPAEGATSSPAADSRSSRTGVARTGEFVVQVAAYRSAAEAMQGWQRLRARLDLSAFAPMTTTIVLPNRGTFHRLSVGGFESRAAAIQACNAIKRQGGACFVRARAGDAPLNGR